MKNIDRKENKSKINRHSALDAESAASWHDAEHVEKIHEFSLHVQNGAKTKQIPSWLNRDGMTLYFWVF